MHEGIPGVGVRVVRVRVLQVRLPLQRGVMVPKMVGQRDGGAAAAGGAPPGGGIGDGGGLPAAADALADPPPALNAVKQPPAGITVAVFDAWNETRNPAEHEQLRADLTAHVWHDRGELLSPYVV